MSTMRVKIYNSVTEDQHVAILDVPIDGKPHRVGDLCKENNPAHPGKVVGNTWYIGNFHGAKFAFTSPYGDAMTRNPQQTGLEQRFGGDEQPLGKYELQDYDVSDYKITATKVA
jgi:hypothetical protein